MSKQISIVSAYNYLFFTDGGVAQVGDTAFSTITALLLGVLLLGVNLDRSNRAVRELVLQDTAGGQSSPLLGPRWSSPPVGSSALGTVQSSVS